MLNIFVCEDNHAQRRTIVQIIQNIVLIEELDMQLVFDTANPTQAFIFLILTFPAI